MSESIFKIEIDGKQYNCARMGADKQFDISHMLGKYNILMMAKDKSAVPAIVQSLMKIPLDDSKYIASSLLSQAFLHGTQTPVTVNSFKDNILAYWRLVAELVIENFQKFYSYFVESLASIVKQNQEMKEALAQ